MRARTGARLTRSGSTMAICGTGAVSRQALVGLHRIPACARRGRTTSSSAQDEADARCACDGNGRPHRAALKQDEDVLPTRGNFHRRCAALLDDGLGQRMGQCRMMDWVVAELGDRIRPFLPSAVLAYRLPTSSSSGSRGWSWATQYFVGRRARRQLRSPAARIRPTRIPVPPCLHQRDRGRCAEGQKMSVVEGQHDRSARSDRWASGSTNS